MAANNKNNEFEKYKHDIETIKDVLLKVDEKPLFENWVFIAYGLFFILGAMINYFIITFTEITITTVVFKFWLPVLLIEMLLEPFALIRKMVKESMPVFSKTIIKLYLGIIGFTITGVFIFTLIARTGHLNMLPSVFLCLWSVAYLFYAQVASSSMFFHGYFLIISGIIIYLTGPAIEIQVIIIALLLGFSSLIIGITEYRKDRKANGK